MRTRKLENKSWCMQSPTQSHFMFAVMFYQQGREAATFEPVSGKEFFFLKKSMLQVLNHNFLNS